MGYEISVRELGAARLAGVLHRGDYRKLGTSFERLRDLLGPGDWAQVRRAAAVGHDNPRRTPEADLRAHACVLVTEAFALRPPFEEIRYPAGRYAIMLLRGPCDQLPEAGRGFIEDWLAASGEMAAGPAPYEVYLNDPRDTPPAELLTEVRLPLV